MRSMCLFLLFLWMKCPFFSRNNFYYFYIENITFSNRLTSESKSFNKVESLLESGWWQSSKWKLELPCVLCPLGERWQREKSPVIAIVSLKGWLVQEPLNMAVQGSISDWCWEIPPSVGIKPQLYAFCWGLYSILPYPVPVTGVGNWEAQESAWLFPVVSKESSCLTWLHKDCLFQ